MRLGGLEPSAAVDINDYLVILESRYLEVAAGKATGARSIVWLS